MPIVLDEVFQTTTIEVPTPDGVMYVFIHNQDSVVKKINITIGKSGSNVAAWCNAVSELMTMLLESHHDINDIRYRLSNITSDRVSFASRRQIRSAIDGIVYALSIYQHRETEPINMPRLNLPWRHS